MHRKFLIPRTKSNFGHKNSGNFFSNIKYKEPGEKLEINRNTRQMKTNPKKLPLLPYQKI